MLGRTISLAATLLAALSLLVGVPAALADAPALLPVQGRLLDAAGTPVDGAKDVTFHLYDAESGGTALFSETQSVTFEQGEFVAYLGSVETLDLALLRDAEAYWLELVVDGETLSPRLRLGSVPYAGFAQYCGDASSLQGTGPKAFAAADHTHPFGDLEDVPGDLSDGDDDTLGGLSCDRGQIARWDGSNWVCDDDLDTTYAAGSGLTLTDGTFAVDTSSVQARVSGSCPAGQSIRAIAADGSVICERDDYVVYRAGTGLQLSSYTFSVRPRGITRNLIGAGAVGTLELGVPHSFTYGTVRMSTENTYYDVASLNLSLSSSARCTFWLTGAINGLDGNEPTASGYYYISGTGLPSISTVNRAIVGRPYSSASSFGTTGTIALTANLNAGSYTYRCRFVPMTSWSTYLRDDTLNCQLTVLCT